MTKEKLLIFLGSIGGLISSLFGGWDAALTTLALFMIIDYISGFFIAVVLKKSPKTETGAASSKASSEGLFKKGMIMAIVIVAAQLDKLSGVSFIKDATVIAFIVNETISIIENAGLMGVKVPGVITKAIDALNSNVENSLKIKRED